MPPELNLKRAVFVLGKIDEILAWDKGRLHERDLRFVDLGRYLCEVRAGQYWRLEKMKSFDDFLEKRFPDSRRKAYYLMAIHENRTLTNLTRISKQQLREIGWTKARELAKVARRERERFESAPWVHKAQALPKEEFKREVERHLTGKETEAWEIRKRQPEAVWISERDELCDAGRAFGSFRGEIPREKLFDLVDRVLRDA